jgi:hypothetical protein
MIGLTGKVRVFLYAGTCDMRRQIEQAYGATWSTVEMTRKANRPLAIVWPNGAVTKERW